MSRRYNKRLFSLTLFGAFIVTMVVFFLSLRFLDVRVDAASLTDPGNVMSDYTLRDYNSMSEGEIQTFLTRVNGCGNRNWSDYAYLSSTRPQYTWHWADGHFVCISEERFEMTQPTKSWSSKYNVWYDDFTSAPRFGDALAPSEGVSAAYIIYKAAQDYKINPKVIITFLQKEQGLITDPIPNSRDYGVAMGYNCPDSGSCPADERDRGFSTQVFHMAKRLDEYMSGDLNYYAGNTYIFDGQAVYIHNMATAALYTYTPHISDKINLYRIYTGWFDGITDTKVNWEKMKAPRIMKVNQSTLIIDVRNHAVVSKWLYNDENYYFTKKTDLFWGGEKQACLQRKIDEGTNRCVLMSRLSDFSLENDSSDLPNVTDYEITQWTCIVNLYNQEAECDKAYSKGDVLTMAKTVTIDDKEFLIENNRNDGYAVLKARTRRKINFEETGVKLMKLTKTTYKYNAGEDKKVQTLTVNANPYIRIANKAVIDGKTYYRTAVDKARDNNYVIPEDALSTDVFDNFKSPRNMMIASDTKSLDLGSGDACNTYKRGDIRKYVKKVTFDGVTYFQSEKEVGTQCAVRATNLSESPYSFSGSEWVFAPFKSPRNMKMKRGGYTVNISDGTTCEEYYDVGDVRKYTSKIDVGGKAFFRSEKGTEIDTKCAMPAEYLAEI